MPAALPTASTGLVVLLGDPVAHSQSPALHNAAFAACGLDLVYLACRVAPGRLEAAIAGLRALGAVGANVTIPHKRAVLPFLDRLTPAAQGAGAANTLFRQDDRWVGDNTDVGGFLDGLQPFADQLYGADMLVWGAGGGARAVVYALLTTFAPATLTLAARRVEQAQALADAFAGLDPAGALQIVPLAHMDEAVQTARLLVNTTPLGMVGHEAATPYPAARFAPGQIVYDLVYVPRPTRLLREAAAAGAVPLDGLAMFRGQAARAFGRWTGLPFPDAALL